MDLSFLRADGDVAWRKEIKVSILVLMDLSFLLIYFHPRWNIVIDKVSILVLMDLSFLLVGSF